MKSFVYFISDSNGHVKVGKANDVQNRLNVLQCGNPYKLSVVHTIAFDTEEEAFAFETGIHNILRGIICTTSAKEPGCEWFNIAWDDSLKDLHLLEEYANSSFEERKKKAIIEKVRLRDKRKTDDEKMQMLKLENADLKSRLNELSNIISTARIMLSGMELKAYAVTKG